MNRMGCLARIGCITLLVLLALVAWLTRDRWMHRITGRTAAVTTGPTWEPITAQGSERTRVALEKLGRRGGPTYTALSGGDVASYVFQALARQLPPSADSVEAAVINDRLYIRASVRISDLGAGGRSALGPLAGLLGDRERMQFGGTFHIIRPGLAEFEVQDLKLRDFSVPPPMIPKLLQQIERGTRPPGLSPAGLPLVIPPSLGDVRVGNGRITLYKSV
jgi:hypothetical protein